MSDVNYAGSSGSVSGANADGPALSIAETLTGIFFEPGRVFESFRSRPRFLVASLLIALALGAFSFLFIQRVGYENMIRAQLESRAPDMDPEQREQAIAQQASPVFKTLAYVIPVIGVLVVLSMGGALYLLGTLAMGKSINYKQALAVWTYSSLPPVLLVTLANLILLFIKAPEDIDVVNSGRGFVRASPGALVDGTASPVLATALGAFDLFAIYGLILAALGLRKVARLSSGGAWTVVIALYLLTTLLKIGFAALLKTPMA